jgi:hypothetical protein
MINATIANRLICFGLFGIYFLLVGCETSSTADCPSIICPYPIPVVADLTSDTLSFRPMIELVSATGQLLDFQRFQVDSMRLVNGRASYLIPTRPPCTERQSARMRCQMTLPWRWADTARVNRADVVFRDSIVLFASYDRQRLRPDTVLIASELTYYYSPCRGGRGSGRAGDMMFEHINLCRLRGSSCVNSPNEFIIP